MVPVYARNVRWGKTLLLMQTPCDVLRVLQMLKTTRTFWKLELDSDLSRLHLPK
jgi:hypothetical protein